MHHFENFELMDNDVNSNNLNPYLSHSNLIKSQEFSNN